MGELMASDATCAKRLSHRIVHTPTNTPYSTQPNPLYPQLTPDSTTIPENQLEKLDKDHFLIVPKLLFVYHLGCEPILNHFGRGYCRGINADHNDVNKIIQNCVEELKKTIFKPNEGSIADR